MASVTYKAGDLIKVGGGGLEDHIYRELFLMAKNGDRFGRISLLYQYMENRDEMPDYCFEYIEEFLGNVITDIASDESSTKKLFPDKPKKGTDF